jgi:hypothetical protein
VAAASRHVDALVLSIEGRQPEKGHATLSVVRALNATRLGFAEALLSSGADEVRRLWSQARAWATQLGLAVHLWFSDKHEACVPGLAAEFPGGPQRDGVNHFPRDLAQPLREADRHATVKMRRTVRGWRAIERAVLQQRRRRAAAPPAVAPAPPPPATPPPAHQWAKDVPAATAPLRMPARSCWIPGAPCVADALTLRGGRSYHPASVWRKPWETSVRRSNATWMPTVAAARTPTASAGPDVSTAAEPRGRRHTQSSVSTGKRASASRPR